MILDLVPKEDRLLKTQLDKFEWDGDINPIELAQNLTETMLSGRGIGLSANQVGINARVCVISSDPVLALFNPRIIWQSEQQEYFQEGCLSFPGLVCKVKRPSEIRVRYEQPNRNTVTERYSGLTARIIQHEIDHLDGIVFFDRATRFHRDQAFRKLKLDERRNKRK